MAEPQPLSTEALAELANRAGFALVPHDELLYEWPCPHCGAVTRAMMADYPVRSSDASHSG